VPRYAALLRGINVGGRQKIPMADLRTLLAALGHTEVRTLLQSGNAVFSAASADPDTLADAISARILDDLGLTVRCLVRTRDEQHAVIAGNPLRDVATDGSRMLVSFLSRAPDPALLAVHDPVALAPGQIHLGDRVMYQWCPDGILEAPPAGIFVERRLKVAATTRNWNTVTKLGALLDT
jgi:uncharacterized protein (DUF1697 family)